MKFSWRNTILGGVGLTTCLLGAVSARSQAPQNTGPTADQTFKDVRILKGIPVDEFMNTMGMFSSALGLCCTDCHVKEAVGNVSAFAIETERINTARQMIGMMNNINRNFFKGEQRVSCYTCHRAGITPDLLPDLALQYGEAPPPSPNTPDIATSTASPQPIFDKYIQALGGAQRVAALTSFTATGTYTGFETGMGPVQLDIYAKAPNQRTLVLKMPEEEGIRVYDGTNGWLRGPESPVPLMTLTGGNLFGARVDALVGFPAGIQREFNQWRTGRTTIDDVPVLVASGTKTGEPPVNFYFDEKTGLLKRTVRWNRSAVGAVPVQTDYDEYRAVAGVQMPHKMTVTWTNGQSFIELKEIRPNVAIDAARFARPAPGAQRK
jgi:outer membrane lipoprotein-sorting protein